MACAIRVPIDGFIIGEGSSTAEGISRFGSVACDIADWVTAFKHYNFVDAIFAIVSDEVIQVIIEPEDPVVHIGKIPR